MPLSEWLQWRKDRWQRKDVPDYFIDGDGTFYCDHECPNLEQHEQERERWPSIPHWRPAA